MAKLYTSNERFASPLHDAGEANTPRELPSPKDFPHWVLRKPGTKIPIDPRTGLQARINDPCTMVSYDHAHDYCRAYYCGAMYAITHDNPHFVADLDDCVDPITGEIAPWALDVMRRLNTRTTYSGSGKGIHCIGVGNKPGSRSQHGKDGGPNGFKGGIYDHSRFIALTDRWVDGFPRQIRDCQAALDSLYPDLFPEPQRVRGAANGTEYADDPLPKSPRMSDLTVLKRILRSKQATKFKDVWRGDDSYHRYDASDADAGLASMLAWWTQDKPQIRCLMERSDRNRDKFDRPDYLTRTIDYAVAQQTERYRADENPKTRLVMRPDGSIEFVAA